jgi:putative membrane protein
MMWGYSYGWSWLGFGGMLLSTLFLAVVLGLAIWAFVRWLPNQQTHTTIASSPSAQEIVRQRYARGEIDAATYHQVLRELTQPDARTMP